MARAGRVTAWSAVPRQDGRRFVVTGANSGVGLETARTLAQRGAHVVLACRNADKGAAAVRDIGRVDGSVEVGLLDVSDLSSVRRFAGEVLAAGPLDVLVNNAGILGVPFGRSVDGIELQLATNHVGHFALANLLLPGLTDRVVVVSSQSHRHGDLRLDDLDWQQRGYSPYGAYGASKLANMLFLAELQRRLTAAGSTLRATGAHPGSTATSITSSSGDGWFAWLGSWGHGLVGMKPLQGAMSTLYAATMDVPGNTYLGPHRLREMNGWPVGVGRSRAAIDPELARAAWTASEELSGVTWPL